MKSQRRHDLQQNALDEELGKGINFLKKWLWHMIMGVACIIILTYIGISIYNNYQVGKMNEQTQLSAWINQKAATDDEVKEAREELAEQTGKTGAIATFLQGRDKMIEASKLGSTDAQDKAKLRSEASAKFNKVISDFDDCPNIHAKARMGLARLAEDSGDFSEAISQYKEIVADSALVGHPIYTLAGESKRRLEDQLKNNDKIRWAAKPTQRMIVEKNVLEFLVVAAKTFGDDADVALGEFVVTGQKRQLALDGIKATRAVLKPAYYSQQGIRIADVKISGNKAVIMTGDLKTGGYSSAISVLVYLELVNTDRWLVNKVIGNKESLAAQKMFNKF